MEVESQVVDDRQDPRIVVGRALVMAFLFGVVGPELMAGGAGAGPLGTVVAEIQEWADALSGPVLSSIGIIAFVVCGAILMFRRSMGQGAQWIAKVVIGVVIGANAAAWVADLGGTGATF